jgi:hypothetical protein
MAAPDIFRPGYSLGSDAMYEGKGNYGEYGNSLPVQFQYRTLPLSSFLPPFIPIPPLPSPPIPSPLPFILLPPSSFFNRGPWLETRKFLKIIDAKIIGAMPAGEF